MMSARGREIAESCLEHCRALSAFTDVPGTITRTFLSPAARNCMAFLRSEMEALQMRVHVDSVGNLRGVYPAAGPNARRLLIGSHIDTVPDGGPYDGVLGVAIALGLLRALDGKRLSFAIEVIAFSEEEGVRFGVPFIGSRALVGTLDSSLFAREDAAGVSVGAAIDAFGLDRSQPAEAVLHPSSIAYLEFHIEQGPVLESLGLPLAVVDSISGQSRAAVAFEGQANHAGTTPMQFRRDALAAASEWIGAVEAHAREMDDLVATVGTLEVPGSAANVVPGKVSASLDVRHASDDIRRTAFSELIEKGAQLARRRKIGFTHVIQLNQNTIPMDPQLLELAGEAIRNCGVESRRLPSGAGHDAMIIAPFLPSVMIFLRSPGGLSHHPGESVLPDDVELALRCGLGFLQALPQYTAL